MVLHRVLSISDRRTFGVSLVIVIHSISACRSSGDISHFRIFCSNLSTHSNPNR